MVATDDIDVDIIWKELGTWGKFQMRHIIVYGWICISWSFPFLSIVFIGHRPSHECKPMINHTDNVTDVRFQYEECNIKTFTNTSEGIQITEEGCPNGWSYSNPIEQSFVSEWDLVCGQAEMAELTNTLTNAGMMVGALVFPAISDHFGRKAVMTFSHVALFAVNIGTVFTSSYVSFVVTRILTGIITTGLLSASTLLLETFPTEARGYTEVFGLLFWTTGIVAMAPVAYLLRNFSWRYLQLTFALIGAWSLVQWWVVDESIRWLILNNKMEQAKVIIKKACKINNKDYDTVMAKCGFTEYERKQAEEIAADNSVADTINSQADHSGDINTGSKDKTRTELSNEGNENGTTIPMLHEGENQVEEVKYTVIAIFKNKEILRVSLILWWLWITDGMIYFGLYLISAELAGNRFLNFFLSALFEYPVALLDYLLINRLGRKRLTILGHVIGGIGLVTATLLISLADGNQSMMLTATAFTLVGKIGMTSAASVVFVYTPELYPTNLRNSAYGLASCLGKIGSMVAPFFRNLAEKRLWAPGAIFTFLVCTDIVLLMFLPETSGVELPQTMSELKAWYTVNQTVCCGKPKKKSVQNGT